MILDSIINAYTNTMNNKSNNAFNAYALAFNRNNMIYQLDRQSEEAEYAREWQHRERIEAQDYQRAEAAAVRQWQREQWQREADWSSPYNVIRRGMAAGLSPAASLGLDGSPSTPVGASASGVQPGPGAMPGSVGLPSTPLIPSRPSVFNFDALGSLIKNLSEARLDDAKRNEITSLLGERVKSMILDNDGKSLYNEAQEIKNQVLSSTKDKQIQRLFEEVDNIVADTALKRIQGENVSEDTLNKQLEGTLMGIDIKDKSLKLNAVMALNYYYKSMLGSLGLQKAMTDSYNEQAQMSAAQTATIDALRDWQVEKEKYGAFLAKNDFSVLSATQQQRINKIVNECIASDLLPEEVRQRLVKAQKDNDWYVVNQLLNIVSTGAGVYGTVQGVKTGKGFVDAQNVRNNIQQEYNDYLQNTTEYKQRIPTPSGYVDKSWRGSWTPKGQW